MERTRQQIVNEIGERLFRGALPAIWVVRKVDQSDDYGIDFEVEVFSDQGVQVKSIGFMFKVQLKSSCDPRYVDSNSSISVGLKKKHIAYYCDELDVPVILVHADATNSRSFWLAPQLLKEIAAQGDPNSADKISVRIPVENELPESLQRMLRDADRAATAIATRKVVSAPIPQLLSSLHPEDRDEELAKSLRDRSDAIRLSQLQQLFVARNYERAEEVINKVLKDSEASVQNKFWALLEEERIILRKQANAGAPQAHRPDATLAIARRLQKLTRHGPAALKFTALITRKAAELDVLTHRVLGLFMNYQVHSRVGNQLWETYALLEKTRTEMQVWRKYNQCVRLARYASTSEHRSATCAALMRILHALVVYLIVLDSEGKAERALQYRKSGFQILQLAAWIAQQVGEYNVVKLAANVAVQLAHIHFAEPSTWAEKIIAEIDEPGERKDAEKWLARTKARKSGTPQEGDIPATEQQIYENMATAIGIPLHVPNHILTQIFHAAVKDADPTRVLSHCKHSFVSIGPVSMFEHLLGEQLGLPIGPKVFECALHGHSCVNGSLDEAYRQFNSRHCQSCPDRKPQPDGWKHSQEWQAAQYERVRQARRGHRSRTARAAQTPQVSAQEVSPSQPPSEASAEDCKNGT